MLIYLSNYNKTIQPTLQSSQNVCKRVITCLNPAATLIDIALRISQFITGLIEKVFSFSCGVSAPIAKTVPWVAFIRLPGSLQSLNGELSIMLKGSPHEKQLAITRFLSEMSNLSYYTVNCGTALNQVHRLPKSLFILGAPLGALSSALSVFAVIASYRAKEESSQVLGLLEMDCQDLASYRLLINELRHHQALEESFLQRHFCSESKFKVLYDEKLLNQFEKALKSENPMEKEAAEKKLQTIMKRLRQHVIHQINIYDVNMTTSSIYAVTPLTFFKFGLGTAYTVLDLTQAISKFVEKQRFEKFLQTLDDEPTLGPVFQPR